MAMTGPSATGRMGERQQRQQGQHQGGLEHGSSQDR